VELAFLESGPFNKKLNLAQAILMDGLPRRESQMVCSKIVSHISLLGAGRSLHFMPPLVDGKEGNGKQNEKEDRWEEQ